jgi:uncharacterized membrane protein YeaQ/YmgE (transglycosylase-associated protein family)
VVLHLTGRKSGLLLATVVGIVRALLGGFLAKALFHVQTLNTFFNLSTWITAIVGAAILSCSCAPCPATVGAAAHKPRTAALSTPASRHAHDPHHLMPSRHGPWRIQPGAVGDRASPRGRVRAGDGAW